MSWTERAVAVVGSVLWAGVMTATVAGCDDGADKPAPSASRERSQAVIVAAGQQAPSAADESNRAGPGQKTPDANGDAAEETKPAHRAGPSCQPREAKERKSIEPKRAIARAAAPGEPALAAELPVGGGSVTWVNFWAAWCVPCKEEIPRLLAWEKTLAAEGIPFRVAFVSLDDDERQLHDFLARQGAEGLRRTYWLREGHQREEWLAKVGMETDPRLPVHLVVSARGETYCTVDGAVEDGDLEEVRRLARAAARP